MNPKSTFVTILLVILFGSTLNGCDCGPSTSFDLAQYDASDNIILAKVIRQVNSGYAKYLAEFKAAEKLSAPQLPLMPPPLYEDFVIKTKCIFKGQLWRNKLTLRSHNHSCKWTPKIGETYIFYLGPVEKDQSGSFLSVGACNRKIIDGADDFEFEQVSLSVVDNRADGQVVLIHELNINNEIIPYRLLVGSFKDWKRDGEWLISEPIAGGASVETLKDSIIILNYDAGRLLSVDFNSTGNDWRDDFWRKTYFFYYQKIHPAVD